MKRSSYRCWLLTLAVCTFSVGGARSVAAQGVTTAAISGRILSSEGQPLPSIEVAVTNLSTGVSKTVLSSRNGQFFVPALPVGGPYRVLVSGLGYEQQTVENVYLTLGQNLNLELSLTTRAVELAGLEVTVTTTDQIINRKRTGAETLVTEHQIENLPTISRNFTDFVAISPLSGAGGGATSVAQQNNRFNNIQIDGAISQDLFGLGSTGQPGGQAGARSITIAAVKEYQILSAPFDVRQSGFTGGLINAVTKAGTNEFRGSFYGTYRENAKAFIRQELVVQQDTFSSSDFDTKILGGTVGGPILRDRVHFFVAGEWEDDNRPGGDVAIGRESPQVTGIDLTVAQRFTQLLEQKGVNAGGFGVRNVENPNRNLFARIDAQLSPTHTLTLRNNFVRAEDVIAVNRGFSASNYSLDSNWYSFTSNTNSAVAQLNSTFQNGLFNELTLGWNRIRDRRAPFERYPEIRVTVPNAASTGGATKTLRAGAEEFSQGNELDQDSWEITNNLSFSLGNHRVTVGVHNETFKFRNLFLPSITGVWTFNSLDDFEAGIGDTFTRNVPAQAGIDPNARFTVSQVSAYAQTEWSVSPNVVVTAGLRYDLPISHDEPIHNPAIESAFGRGTDELPSGNGIISPRLGFNWDVNGDRVTQVRGGVGVFAGRFPFVWYSNVFSNTGLFTVNVRCLASNNNLPTFTIDPNAQPQTCLASGTPAPPLSVINLVDPDFKFPHAWRFNAAVDRELPWGIVGTGEFVYSRSIDQIFLRELNVNFSSPVSMTQGGRPVFGTHREGALASGASNTNLASPRRLRPDDALAVVELTNSDQDRSYSFTLQAQKRYTSGIDINTSYTYARAEDVSGLTSSIATSNIGFNPVKGSPNTPELATSDYETRHKVVFSGAWDARPWLTWSLLYIGNSGEGYSYVYDGDVNADGFEASYASNRFNDLLYVPTGPNDITLTDAADWTRLNAYIEGENCLSEARGTIISRNVCREPWRHRVDTRFTFKVPTIGRQRAEVTLSISNLLNLINEDWGLNRGVVNPTIDLLELRGWDVANNRGIFRPTARMRLDNENRPNQLTTFDPSSRYGVQLGVRYAF